MYCQNILATKQVVQIIQPCIQTIQLHPTTLLTNSGNIYIKYPAINNQN